MAIWLSTMLFVRTHPYKSSDKDTNSGAHANAANLNFDAHNAGHENTRK